MSLRRHSDSNIKNQTNLKPPSRHRSSTGCFTCRKRKKKCDEKLYPICLSCQDKKLTCEWPKKVDQIRRHLDQVKYYGDEKIKKPEPKVKEPEYIHVPDPAPTDEIYLSEYVVPTPPKSYLERIALQQDCVEDKVE